MENIYIFVLLHIYIQEHGVSLFVKVLFYVLQ